MGITYAEKFQIFSVREALPLADRSIWELAKSLLDKGWTWQLMPRDIKSREALPVHDATKNTGIFYTLGSTLIRPYLLCLLQSNDLCEKFAIIEIPHYFKDAPVKRYQAILAGNPLPPQEPKRRRHQPIADLQQEFPSDEEQLALQDGEPEEAVDDAGSDEDGAPLVQDDDGEDIIQMLEAAIEEEELLAQQQFEATAAQALQQEPEDEQDDLQEEASEEEQEEVAALEADVLAQQADPSTFGPLRTIPWGCFVIARKRVAGQEKALECRCKFHAKNKKTSCKKTITYSEDNEQHALSAARWWCNQALDMNTQKDHLELFNDLLEVPFYPYDVLLQGQITTPPVGKVKTDIELHAEMAAQQRQPKRGRGKQGEGRGRQRGRGRGRRGRAAASQPSDTSEMGSIFD